MMSKSSSLLGPKVGHEADTLFRVPEKTNLGSVPEQKNKVGHDMLLWLYGATSW